MARRVLDTTDINIKRESLIQKGHLTRKDITVFVPCGRGTASKIYNSIREEVKAEGLENCQDVILAKRILKYMGLTAESVHAAAKIERRGS